MHPGGFTTQAPGHTRDMVRWFEAQRSGPRSVRVRFQPAPGYEGRWFGVYVNGALRPPAVYAAPGAVAEAARAVESGTTKAFVYLEDFGGWPGPRGRFDPHGMARAAEARLADRLAFAWRAPRAHSESDGGVTAASGDSQLSNVSVDGAIRFANVAPVQGQPTRGRLGYAIATTGGVHTVTWYRGSTPVAEGSRSGDGAVVCAPVNGSGLSVSATLAYSGDVEAGAAFVELRWPEAYQVHYSASALTFPRVPEIVALDTGRESFAVTTPALASGTYQAAVVPVRDGIEQASGILAVTGLSILAAPEAPVLGMPTGNAAATTINWTPAEAGASYAVYASKIDEPVNFGGFAAPAPIATAVDATSAVLAAVTGYPGRVRVAVRATKGGVEETNGGELVLEYDAAGELVPARPNRATATGLSADGLTLSVTACIAAAEADAEAAYADLYVQPAGTPIDLDTPQDSAALSAPVNGVQRTVLSFTASAPGWHRFAVLTRAANSSRSAFYALRDVYLAADAPGGPESLSVDVLRGTKE
ncbi:MAG: hypothetical protein L6R28_01660 [Planctomycetes bacterium]|nr:hypothetical protein [Planctomycetota bacterium]